MKGSNSIRSDRGFAGVAAALAFAMAATTALAQPAAPHANVPAGPGSLSGMWANAAPAQAGPQLLRAADGKPAPLQPWARQLLDKRIKDARPGHPFAAALSLCQPSGIPTMMFYPGARMQILEEPEQVTFLNAEPNYFRIVRLNQPHRDDPDPAYKGDSVGHWEGDTLVVDTVGLNDQTALDAAGTPHSEELHVVERYRRTGKDAIELTVTLDDPKAFTRPWTAKTVFQPTRRGITESLCDSKRDLLAKFARPAGAPAPSASR